MQSTAGAEDELAAWIEADKATTDGEALVATIRPMRSSEVLRFHGSDDGHIALYAARLCTVSITGPGLNASERGDVAEVLDRLRPSDLASLGSKIVEVSLLPPDPSDAPA